MKLKRTAGPFGIVVQDIDLRLPMSDALIGDLREAWLHNKVLVIPDQKLDERQLEQVSLAFGAFGEDPFLGYIEGSEHIAEIRREADEASPLFAEVWHSDWSFLPRPPAGTLLYGKVIPPQGGDTLFTDNVAAYAALTDDMKSQLASLKAVHSPVLGYSKQGLYGDMDAGRSIDIRPSDAANVYQSHPLVLMHPETSKNVLFINPGYTLAIDGMEKAEYDELLGALFVHQAQEQFVYRHQWAKNMLVLWDNRSVNHMATGGYDGYQRVLQRITII